MQEYACQQRIGESGREKGYAAEVSITSRVWMLVRRIRSAGLSQNSCEALSMVIRCDFVFFRISMDRFAGDPFFYPDRTGCFPEYNIER